MTGAIRHNAMLRALFCAMVALAFAARLLAPAGFMPVATAKGVMVTLCTGQGAVRMMVDREQVPNLPGHEKGQGKAMEHCPFAGASAAPALPMLAALGLLPVWHSAAGPVAFALKTGWIARLAAPPPPASGPPHPLD